MNSTGVAFDPTVLKRKAAVYHDALADTAAGAGDQCHLAFKVEKICAHVWGLLFTLQSRESMSVRFFVIPATDHRPIMGIFEIYYINATL